MMSNLLPITVSTRHINPALLPLLSFHIPAGRKAREINSKINLRTENELGVESLM